VSQWSGPRSGCCEQDHATQPFSDIRCKQCRIVIFLSGLPRANETCWSAAIIVASYLLAIFLLRHSGPIWPSYALASLTIVNLLAMAFSRGAAIEVIAAATSLAVLAWCVWWAGLARAAIGHSVWHWAPIVLWATSLAHAFILGRFIGRDDFRRFGTILLMCVAFIFGAWGLLVANIEYRIGYSWLAGFFFLIVAGGPLIFVITDVIRSRRGPFREGKGYALLTSVSIYLTVLQFVIGRAIGVLDRLPRRILGLPVARVAYPSWFALLAWKTEISVILIGGAAVAVVLWASYTVAAGQAGPGPRQLEPVFRILDSTVRWLDSVLSDRRRRIRDSADPASFIVDCFTYVVLWLARKGCIAAWYTWLVIGHIWEVFGADALRRLAGAWLAVIRRLVIPMACFSIGSLLLMMMISAVFRYESGAPHAGSAIVFWCGIMCAAGLMLVLLCCGSFGLSAGSPHRPWSEAELSLEWVPAALLVADFFFLLISLPSILPVLLGYLLDLFSIHASALGIGWLQLFNMCVALWLLGALTVAHACTGGFSRDVRTAPDPDSVRIMNMTLIGSSSFVVLFALALGCAPVASWLAGGL